MSVLQNWHDTGKPPLLGPQTSALPINQSAIYFYLLYPGFLLSHASPVAQNYLLVLFYLIFYIAAAIIFHKVKPSPPSYLIFGTILLTIIQPQLITQNRSVWNPSFVPPLIFSSIFSFYYLLQKFSTKLLLIFSASISLAISFSYSAAPLLIVFLIYWLIFNRQNFFKYVLAIATCLIIINFPTIIFESRHHILIPALFRPNSLETQSHLSSTQKTESITYCLTGNQNYYFVSIFIALFVLIYSYIRHRKLPFYLAFLYLGTVIGLYLIPITVQCHYLFPLICTTILLLACLPPALYVLLVLFILSIFATPSQLKTYFQKAPRTYAEMSTCFQKYCSQFKQPTYVTVVSNYHPWHNGPESRYLLKQSGCSVLDIESGNSQSNYMTVVLDNGTFDTKTNYYELGQFGNHQEINRLKCLPHLEVVTLTKK